MHIAPNHPIRDDISSLADYHPSIADCISLCLSICRRHNMTFEPPQIEGVDGYATTQLFSTGNMICCDECQKQHDKGLDNMLVLSWYKMSDVKWEVITYIS